MHSHQCPFVKMLLHRVKIHLLT
uniref:Uncharacterized protein n=1 Tax=Rhizophora mucronata TaxID=61149 RepID=A0A2P2NRI9_RHIMU